MFLTKIQTLFKKHKKVVLYTTIFCVLSFLLWDVSFANEAPSEADSIQKGINSVLEVLNIALSVISVMLALLTYLATLFLDPSWLNGSVFGLSDKFKEIWILVSNIVYFAFAFILIWIALVNIVWKAGDKFQLKQALPRFIAWILIVPFSWFIVQFILSVSAILTVSALTLPMNTFPDYNETVAKIQIPSKCQIDLSHNPGSDTSSNWFSCDEDIEWWNTTGVSLKDSFEKWDVNTSIFATISMYTYGVIQIDKLDQFTSSDLAAGIQSSIWFVVKLVIDVLFILIYVILMFALTLVLITRGFYIWMYVMLSPIFWLMYFFEKWNGWDGFLWKFSIKEFVALAMVPVYTLLALSFGMLIMYVVWTWLNAEDTSWEINGFTYKENTFTIWNFSLEVKWAVGQSSDGATVQNTVYRFMKEWTEGALWAIWVLIMQLFGLAVLWISVMAWMKSSKITAEVIAPLDAFGKQIWWLIAKAPQYAPIFPGGQSMQSMQQVAGKVSWAVNQKSIDSANKFAKKMPFLDDGVVDRSTKLQTVTNTLDKYGRNVWATPSTKQDFIDILKAAEWDSTNMVNNKDFEAAFKKLGQRLGMSPGDIAKFDMRSEASIASTVVKSIEAKFDDRNLGLLDWVGKDGAVSTDDLRTMVKWVSDGSIDSTNNVQGVNNSWIERGNKVAAWENKYIIDFNLNGWNTVSWTTWTSGKVEWFRSDDYKDLATFIFDSNINSVNKLNDMFDRLDISDNTDIRNTIKWEIAKYITSEWKIDIHQDKGNIDNLNKFLSNDTN